MKNDIENKLRNSYDLLLEDLKGKSINNKKISLLYESAIYHLSVKGKMIRPLIMANVNHDLNNNYESIEGFALALEMIHNFSLIHDDLPALDDDDYRRNQLAVHKKYGEDIGILSGDYLLSLAFDLLSSVKYIDTNNLENYIKAINYLIYNTNDMGMLGGQIMDINSQNITCLEDLLTMYELKTSALFKTAFTIAPILVDKNSDEIKDFEDLGKYFGLYFQIKDDIDDREEDEKINKVTIFKFLSLDEINSLLKEYHMKVINILEKLNLTNTSKTLDFIL